MQHCSISKSGTKYYGTSEENRNRDYKRLRRLRKARRMWVYMLFGWLWGGAEQATALRMRMHHPGYLSTGPHWASHSYPRAEDTIHSHVEISLTAPFSSTWDQNYNPDSKVFSNFFCYALNRSLFSLGWIELALQELFGILFLLPAMNSPYKYFIIQMLE